MKVGNRKLVVTMTALLGALLLALLGKLTPDYAMVASIAVGAFAAANTFEHKFQQPLAGNDAKGIGG